MLRVVRIEVKLPFEAFATGVTFEGLFSVVADCVNTQLRLKSKYFGAVGAFKELTARVDDLMNLQLFSYRECLATSAAFVGASALVTCFVDSQGGLHSELFVTFGALKGLCARVRNLVSHEAAFGHECFVTRITSVRFGICVPSFVDSQVRLPSKIFRADGAFERPFAAVSPCVVVEYVSRLECFLADVAAEGLRYSVRPFVCSDDHGVRAVERAEAALVSGYLALLLRSLVRLGSGRAAALVPVGALSCITYRDICFPKLD